jgi:MFS family permease
MSENPTKWKWWQGLTAYHWFVFAMASLAWLFDCLDQQIFILVRKDALKHLLPSTMDASQIGAYSGYATSIFMIGWATGGLIFGSVGDWFGRAKTLTLTVLLYSVCTGLSAFSTGWFDFAVYRFITGMGVGGVFGLAVTLVADSLPANSRTGALGTLQALSAVGNISSGLIYLFISRLVKGQVIEPGNSWKIMFLVGALPAFLCVFLQLKLKEPEAWVKARAEGKISGVKFGSYSELFGDAILRRNAIFGMLLCVAGIIGVWGIGFFAPDLVKDVITNNLIAQGAPPERIAEEVPRLVAYNGISQNIGAFIGMMGFAYVAQAIGRRIAFAIAFVLAMVATIAYFQTFNGIQHIWMTAVMGICQMALFGGFAIYLPELFPIRLRSTGTSFCYNVGRYVAASGPITLGLLQLRLAEKAKQIPDAVEAATFRIDAFRDACSYMSVIFLVGLIAVYFLPETKGRPLPQ